LRHHETTEPEDRRRNLMRIITLEALDLEIGWAFFKVLATMVHPNDPRSREEFLAIVWARTLL
jgi:hypothetical protein